MQSENIPPAPAPLTHARAFLTRLSLRRPHIAWGDWAEVTAIILWAAWVGRVYLNLDPSLWPRGNDFSWAVAPNYMWELFRRCGPCMLWNGSFGGGLPALAEVFGAPLHPLVLAGTLLWGPVGGAKITIVGSLALAGLAQWWLARTLRLGAVPRLWSAALAVAGGHLAGRMSFGLFGLVLSTASASLVVAAGLDLALTGRRRSALLLAVMLALALVSGQGYLQFGLALGVLPAFVVFFFDRRLRLQPVWKEFALALGLALLLAGVIWVPTAHFWPYFAKAGEPSFKWMQPLEYAPLNLVIRDTDFFARSDALQKGPGGTWHFATYIGWVPVLLAVLALRLVPRSGSRVLAFLGLATGLTFLAGGVVTIRALALVFPNFAAGLRSGSVICGLAVPLILTAAAWGLDSLLRLHWPALSLTIGEGEATPRLAIRLSWLVLAVPLIWSLRSAVEFGRAWMAMEPAPSEGYELAEALHTDSAQWVSPPWGDPRPLLPGIEAGLKFTWVLDYGQWKDRDEPKPYIIATRDAVDTALPTYLGAIGDANLVLDPEAEYAFVDTGDRRIPCRAQAQGGNIDVNCDCDTAGTLIVRENAWSGWGAQRDGQAATLLPGPWLSVQAPAGRHHFAFRYRPWDVPLGLAVTAIGIGMAIRLWLKRGPSA